LRARLAGYVSQGIELTERQLLDDPDIGTLILHPNTKVEGYTYSMTTAEAPADAQKAYQKGFQSARKLDWPEAEELFRKAVTVYPKYAVAWEALGSCLGVEQRFDDAKAAFLESAKSDPHFVTPQIQLMKLAGARRQWGDVEEFSRAVVRLDPYSYPTAYYFSAVANMNLGHLDVAESAARQGLKQDTRGQVPKLNQILGFLLVEKKAYAEALPYLRGYLTAQPDAADAATIRHLAEQASRGVGTATPQAEIRQ
jgi:tetratricopeptide (TPR) repeat protein